MEKEAVSNSSSIIYIAKLNIFNLAKNIFSKIILPKAVVEELFEKNFPENEIIKSELNKFLEERDVKVFKELPLDEGEKAAISLCLEKNIRIFLSDDKKARKTAEILSIKVVGTVGIILENLRRNNITKQEAKKILQLLLQHSYCLSTDTYAKILELIES